MPNLQLYSKLLQTPLFTGISKRDLATIVQQTKFDFKKFDSNQYVIKEGYLCDKVYFLTDGSITISNSADDKSYTITEKLYAPTMFQPELLFGLNTRFSSDIITTSVCNFITIDKKEVINLSDKYIIFKINLMNLLSAKSQKSQRQVWHNQPKDLRGRIIKFITDHCTYPAGEKVISIKMKNMANEINDGRLNISIELNKMVDEKLIELHRGSFIIPALERLLM